MLFSLVLSAVLWLALIAAAAQKDYKDLIGRSSRICGRVVTYTHEGKDCEVRLDLGRPYWNPAFYVVVPASARSEFLPPPEEIKGLEAELRNREEKPSNKPLPELSGWVREQLQDLTGLLKSDPARVKAEFRRLNLQLTFHPTEAEPRPYYVVKGQCDLGALAFFYLRSRRPGAVLDSMRERSEQ